MEIDWLNQEEPIQLNVEVRYFFIKLVKQSIIQIWIGWKNCKTEGFDKLTFLSFPRLINQHEPILWLSD